ncbi:ROK family protein [Microtetraspora sp. NBRC 16547]|uniref:ROK family protein n=1 Tax=Microtetraspora sp. NBRC 16547 TaxID=3030993 RepID=UPI0024A122B9|nr:ROK family protein [Microtetraspora sp. NBRC 16547]GLX00839.1 sugar kinase [Microtetraspora sp. NBRC 16547]
MSYVVALDVGGTSMKGGLVTRSGEVTPFEGRPTERERGAWAVVAAIRAYVGELAGHGLSRFGVEPSGVGLAVPGIVTSSMALYSANIGWRDVPAEDFVPGGVPARLGHDVRTGGLAESVFGAGRDTADFLFLPIGTGIAGAVVVRGEPYGGAHGWGGEIGHTPVWPSGETCACGQIGCLETYASASAVARRFERRSGRTATAKEVVALAVSGDAAAREVFDEAIEALAISLASYTLLLDPSLIVIGGGLGEAGPVLFEPLRERLAARLAFCEPPELRPAALGVHAGMLGAALLGWQAAGEPGVGVDWTAETLLGGR